MEVNFNNLRKQACLENSKNHYIMAFSEELHQDADMYFRAGFNFAQRWIPVEEGLPKHLELCLFRLDNGNICIGKCNYFEHGDSELIEMYGKGLSYLCHSYRNWDLHDFKWENKFTVTHWISVPFYS